MLNLISALIFAVLPACPTEDAANCRWDASRQGNEQGASFFDLGGFVFYVEVK